MLSKRMGLALLAAVVLVGGVAAQELKQVSIEDASRHVVKRLTPQYPKMAEVAHIQGDVIVRVTVNEEGKVTGAKAVSGHPLFIGPAIQAIGDWLFEPFVEDGKPVPVSALVKVEFKLGPGAELRQ